MMKEHGYEIKFIIGDYCRVGEVVLIRIFGKPLFARVGELWKFLCFTGGGSNGYRLRFLGIKFIKEDKS